MLNRGASRLLWTVCLGVREQSASTTSGSWTHGHVRKHNETYIDRPLTPSSRMDDSDDDLPRVRLEHTRRPTPPPVLQPGPGSWKKWPDDEIDFKADEGLMRELGKKSGG